MTTLTLENMPDATYETLKARAKESHRSLNGEILAIIDMTLLGGGTRFFTMPENSDTHGGDQKASILMAAGGWRDSRSESEIIDDIRNHRTLGREVAL